MKRGRFSDRINIEENFMLIKNLNKMEKFPNNITKITTE
jgi:hypothetical protein